MIAIVDARQIKSYVLGQLIPTVLRIYGFWFFFYSLEGSEPAHVHVEHGDNVAKFWLEPVSLAESHGFRMHEINRLRALVIEHRLTFKRGLECPFRPLKLMQPPST